MKISQKFQVNQAPPLVWDALADVALVAECLKGEALQSPPRLQWAPR